MEQYTETLEHIPQEVYGLALDARDMDSFQWAISHSAEAELHYDAVLRIWNMGKEWRDYFIVEYPEQTLAIFMSEAVNDYSVRFFDQHIDAFSADGYQLTFPLDTNEFFPRFGTFFAEEIDAALRKEDLERIRFLLDYMPDGRTPSGLDRETQETMRSLSDYVCHKLKDEALACRLVELGYSMERVDLDATGFGGDFARALLKHPDDAVTRVLHLDEWHGPLTRRETNFLLAISESSLHRVHKLYLNEVIGATMKSGNSRKTMQLLKLREEIAPMSISDYDRLLGWSLEYRNRAVYDYLKSKATQVDVFELDLVELGGNWNMFRLHAPKIFAKIYQTMDTAPRSDGTTLGRIDALLRSPNPEAVEYVLTKYDLVKAWEEIETAQTLLMTVCEGGNLEGAKYLIEKKKADIHAETYYSEASVSLFGSAEATEGKLTPIFFAAMSGNSDLIAYLARRGASVNSRTAFGATPLMYAVSANHPEAVQTLIRLGADVNSAMSTAVTPSDLAANGLGREDATAYSRARSLGSREMMNILEKAGARTR
jgi:hypothetical protein